ncbi:uncharacterized protein KQ657_005128 [Scheffersomyces spartinae]|uniref:Transcription initiation factor TFIID subunit 8 n=1 Tax=Scheffersomyces spartinae TaxID=45513 RepID=A0A9P7VAP6_9ASCO|nr:uncharacterized protein KQ657_005128 [Scheffersomyces spartinae]KAG7193929.1 hypothetical protein KQ657_005128 [Scheffersomyces spartinae]
MTEIDFSVLDYQFSQVVGAILQGKGYHYSQEFLDELSNQGILYFHELITTLAKFTALQRRTQPSFSDVEVTLAEHGIKASEVYYAHTDLQRRISSEIIDTINQHCSDISKSLEQDHIEFDESDPSHAFSSNEQYEITELVPQQTSRPHYIPDYFPELPPDFTYHSTPQYMKMLTDMKEMRLKLVAESRMQENSLYVLMDDEEIRWKEKFEAELAEIVEDSDIDKSSEDEERDNIMSDSETKMNTDVESPIHEVELVKEIKKDGSIKEAEPVKEVEPIKEVEPVKEVETPKIVEALNGATVPGATVPESVTVVTETQTTAKVDNAFDVVEYAKKRLNLRREREARIEESLNKRKSNVFIKAEKYFSPYAEQPADDKIKTEFRVYLQQGFITAINSIRKAELKKKQTIEEILAGRAKKERERELEREKVQFGFTFHGDNDTSSDSETENVFDNQAFPTFGFGHDGDTRDEEQHEQDEHEQDEHEQDEHEQHEHEQHELQGRHDHILHKDEHEDGDKHDYEQQPLKAEIDQELDQNEEFNDSNEIKSNNLENQIGFKTVSILNPQDSDEDDFLEAELENAMFEHSQTDGHPNMMAPEGGLQLDSDSDVDMEDV